MNIAGLHVHLKSVHKIDLIKRKFGESDLLNNTTKPKPNTANMTDSSLSAVLARMTASDGLPFQNLYQIHLISQILHLNIFLLKNIPLF